MCHEQGELKQSLCLKHINTELWYHPSVGNSLRGLHVLLMEKPPALVSNSAFSCVTFSRQHGAVCGTMAGVLDVNAELKDKAIVPAPTSVDFLQHGPSARSHVCTGAQSRVLPRELHCQMITNSPFPPLLPPEWAERLAPGLQGGPCENGGGAAAQGDSFGDNDQGKDKEVWPHWSQLCTLPLLPDMPAVAEQ